MSKKNPNKCSFCGKAKEDVQILIAGVDGYICENCITQAKQIVDTEIFHLPEKAKEKVERRQPAATERRGEDVEVEARVGEGPQGDVVVDDRLAGGREQAVDGVRLRGDRGVVVPQAVQEVGGGHAGRMPVAVRRGQLRA